MTQRDTSNEVRSTGDFPYRQPDAGKDRAPENEGYDAPRVTKGGVAQQSVFDGAGNETVVVTGTTDEGTLKQGTGKTAAEALEDARDPSEPIGKGFYPDH